MALLPVVVAGTYWCGGRAIIIVGISLVSAQGLEWLVALCRKQPLEIRGGALIMGVLVGLILPPTVPWWVPAFGAVVGLGIGKIAFGGAFRNLFNPAIVGIVALVALFPELFSGYGLVSGGTKVDAITGATPFHRTLPDDDSPILDTLIRMCTKPIGESIGESNGAVIIICGIFLIIRRVIHWLVPATIFGVVIFLGLLYGKDPILQVFSGGLILCAFFMATDIGTEPDTRMGKFIHALWLGAAIVLVREFTDIPSEGVAYGLLIMNGLTPLINKVCWMVTTTKTDL